MTNPRLAEIQRITETRLRYISVHLLDHCNSKCEFCVVNSPLRQKKISTEVLVDFVKSFEGKGFDVLNIHGGEPTIAPALFPVLEAGQSIGVNEVHLQSNARKFHKRDYVDKLIDHGVKMFIISLHGHTAELQEKITLAPKSFDNIIRGIRNCVESGALVRVNSVVCNDNFEHMGDVFHLVNELGVPWLNISALHPSEHAQAQFEKLVPHPRDVRSELPRVLDELKKDAPDLYVDLEGFATCFVPGFSDSHLKKWNRDIHMKYHQFYITDYENMMDHQERAKVPGCEGCKHIDQCNGVYKAYVTRGHFDIWPEYAKPMTAKAVSV